MIKVVDKKASDNEYLHKDFHGALCYGIKYLDDTFGPDVTADFLRTAAAAVYSPLIDDMKKRGLDAMQDHLRNIFDIESGEYEIRREKDRLTLIVKSCPAIKHLRQTGQLYAKDFCRTTVIANETICRSAGFSCSCKYDGDNGTCVQIFWK